MTNCLTSRAAMLADPTTQDAALLAHLADCPACRAAAAAAMRNEALLRSAIQVQVPEQLQERILLQTELKRRRANFPNWLRDRVAGLVRAYPGGLALALSVLISG